MVIDHNETDEDGDNEESKTDNMVSNENVIDKLLNSSNTSNLEPSDTDAEDMQFSEKNIRYAKNSPSEKKNAISHHETNKYASPEKSKDDGYDWILKQAQAARYKKQISKKQKINDEEFTVSFIDNDDNPEKQDGDEGSKFYHYFAVPALVRQNDIPPNNGIQEEDKDEYSVSFMKESHSSQFGFYHDRPKVQQNDNEASFSTVKKAYFTMNNNKSQDYEYQMPGLYDDKYNDNKQSHEMFAQDPDLQQEAIGEILFKSSRLKGFKKIYYIYMFLTSSLRFIWFRNKKPMQKTFVPVLTFIILLMCDITITFNLFLHMKSESDDKTFSGIGIYYFFFYPGIAIISPILGLMSLFWWNTTLLKMYALVNSISCISNMMLTLIFQLVHDDQLYYVMEILIVILLRILLNNLANYQIAIFT